LWGILLLTLGVAACVTAPRVVTDAELAAARKAGNVATLYDEIAKDAASRHTPDPVQQETLAALGHELATARIAEIDTHLAAAELDDGLLPLVAIRQAQASVVPMERWERASFTALTTHLDAARRATEAEVDRTKANIVHLAPEQVVEQVEANRRLLALHGVTDDGLAKLDAYEGDVLARQYGRGNEALERKLWGAAERALYRVVTLCPDYLDAPALLLQARQGAVKAAFLAALETGEVERAVALADLMRQVPDLTPLHTALQAKLGELADYFASVGSDRGMQGDFLGAFHAFRQVHEVRPAGGVSGDEEAAFLDHLARRARAALAARRPGLALGCYYLISDLDPTYPELRHGLHEAEEAILDFALKRVATLEFGSPEGAPQIGKVVSAKVTQYLFEEAADDVRIVERGMLDQILREHEIDSIQGGDAKLNLAGADYLIQGTVMEARVESSQFAGQKRKRVTTGHKQVTNPEHATWEALLPEKRATKAEPEKTLDEPVVEDVSYKVTVFRKVGAVGVSYRIVDAATTKLLFADSVRAQKEVEDESTEGVELGNFSIPFKMARLPSDMELLDNLAESVSNKIGTALLRFVGKPEVAFVRETTRLEGEGDDLAACEPCASALILDLRKGEETNGLRRRLEHHAAVAASLTF